MDAGLRTGATLYIDDPWSATYFAVFDQLTLGLWVDVEFEYFPTPGALELVGIFHEVCLSSFTLWRIQL